MASTFFRFLHGPNGSREQAKDRLLSVLVSDRLGLNPDQMQALRRDILATISRYVPIDSGKVHIGFVHENSPGEVVINAPIRRTKPA